MLIKKCCVCHKIIGVKLCKQKGVTHGYCKKHFRQTLFTYMMSSKEKLFYYIQKKIQIKGVK